MMEKRQRNRFSFEDDLFLLKEVLAYNPFEHFTRWETVCENIRLTSGKNFSIRAIKEHVEHLLQLYMKHGRASLRKSLTEEQCNEKDQLLKEVKELWTEYKKKYQMWKQEKDIERQKALTARNNIVINGITSNNVNNFISEEIETKVLVEDYTINSVDPLEDEGLSAEETTHQSVSPLHNYQQSPTTSIAGSTTQTSGLALGPIRTRNSQKWIDSSNYLREKQDWEKSMRERELQLQERKIELEERKLKLEEEKFQLEKEERTKRLQIEIKERENNMSMLQQQQNIISYFLNTVKSE